MWEDFKVQVIYFSKAVGTFLINKLIGRIALILTILSFLYTIGVLKTITDWLLKALSVPITFVSNLYYGIPIYYWWLYIFVFLILFILSIRQYLYLRLVSGVFQDDFKY